MTDPSQEGKHPTDAEDSTPPLWPPVRGGYVKADGDLAFAWSSSGFRINRGTPLDAITLHSFPMTEDGWQSAWETLKADYPDLAVRVATRASREVRARKEEHQNAELRAERQAMIATLPECILLGGYGIKELKPRDMCTIEFAPTRMIVSKQNWEVAVVASRYNDARELELSGRGRFQEGGGFIGGGFGLKGAAAGMMVASVLNLLTSRTGMETVIRYEAVDMEMFFFYEGASPHELRIQLSEVISKIGRSATAPSRRPMELIDAIERLAALRSSGALSDSEYAVLKAKLIGDS